MDDASSIQHAQMMQALIGVIAGGAVALIALLGRWIGGVWIILLACCAALLLSFHPLIHAQLFSNITTDRLQMILLGIVPFTVVQAIISLRRIPVWVHLVFALLGPALVLGWVFHDYAVESVPRQTLYLHQILPVALGIFAVWILLEPIARRSPGVAAPLTLTVISIAWTFLFMLSAESNTGLMATPVAGTAGGATAAALLTAFIFKKPLSLARGPVLFWAMTLGSLFAFLFICNDAPLPKNYLWMALIPPLAWIPEIGPIHRLKPWKRESIRLVLVIIPAVISMVLVFKQHKAEAAAAGDEFGLNYAQPAAPISPSQIPIPNTINPPTMT